MPQTLERDLREGRHQDVPPIGEAAGAKHRYAIGLVSALSQRSSESVWFWFWPLSAFISLRNR